MQNTICIFYSYHSIGVHARCNLTPVQHDALFVTQNSTFLKTMSQRPTFSVQSCVALRNPYDLTLCWKSSFMLNRGFRIRTTKRQIGLIAFQVAR